MHHSFWDKYSNLNSPVHRLDCRVKIILFSILVITIVSVPAGDFNRLLLFGALVISVLLLSRLPLDYVLKRSLIIIPFVLLIAFFTIFFNGTDTLFSFRLFSREISVYREGLYQLKTILCKSWLSALCLLILAESTEFNYLLKGLEKLRFPKILILVIAFFYRYVFLLIDQLDRMQHAIESRGGMGRLSRRIKVVGSMIGWLFISTYTRAERVYFAMLSRGFTGNIHTLRELKTRGLDIVFSLVLISLAMLIRLGDFKWIK